MRLLSIRGDVGQVGPAGETKQKTWDTVYVPADDNYCSAEFRKCMENKSTWKNRCEIFIYHMYT